MDLLPTSTRQPEDQDFQKSSWRQNFPVLPLDVVHRRETSSVTTVSSCGNTHGGVVHPFLTGNSQEGETSCEKLSTKVLECVLFLGDRDVGGVGFHPIPGRPPAVGSTPADTRTRWRNPSSAYISPLILLAFEGGRGRRELTIGFIESTNENRRSMSLERTGWN